MSFAFVTVPGGVDWLETRDGTLREVRDVAELYDVSIITGMRPAYPATADAVSARARQHVGASTALLRLPLRLD